MKKILAITALVAVAGVSFAAALQSKYDADANTTSSVVFGPAGNGGQLVVKSVSAVSTGTSATVKFYVRTGSKLAPTANATNGAQVIYISNTGNVITTNDLVAYVHADGSVDYTTASANTASNVTLAAGISSAGASGDYLYELALGGQRNLGAAAVDITGDAVFATPTDSPLRVLNDGTGGNSLTVTVQQ